MFWYTFNRKLRVHKHRLSYRRRAELTKTWFMHPVWNRMTFSLLNVWKTKFCSFSFQHSPHFSSPSSPLHPTSPSRSLPLRSPRCHAGSASGPRNRKWVQKATDCLWLVGRVYCSCVAGWTAARRRAVTSVFTSRQRCSLHRGLFTFYCLHFMLQ